MQGYVLIHEKMTDKGRTSRRVELIEPVTDNPQVAAKELGERAKAVGPGEKIYLAHLLAYAVAPAPVEPEIVEI